MAAPDRPDPRDHPGRAHAVAPSNLVPSNPVPIALVAAALLAFALATAPPAVRAVLGDTLAVTAPASALAVLATFPTALHVHLPSRIPTAVPLAVGVIAALVPSPVLGNLAADLLGVAPYTTAHLALTAAWAALPVSFLTQALLLRALDPRAITQAHALGVRTSTLLRRAYRREILVALAIGWQTTMLLTATDPGITLPFGGNDSHLADASLHATSSVVAPEGRRGLLLVVAAACLLVAAQVPRTVLHRSAAPAETHYSTTPWPAVGTVALACVTGTGVAGLVCLVLAHAGQVDPAPVLASTLMTTVPPVILAFPLALAGAYVVRHRPRTTLLPVLVLLGALTLGGPVVSLAFAGPLRVGGVTLVPALVGGGGVAGGYWALALVSLLIAYPILFLAARSAVGATRAQIAAARDAGAGGVRTFVTVVWPRTVPGWLASTAVVLALLLTRTAPAVYLEAPGFPQAPAVLARAAATADGATLYVLGAATHLTGLTLLVLLLALVPLVRREVAHV